jgi:subtilase family serine protease
VRESDEGNNTGYTSITVRQDADLVVSSVSCPPSATSPGTIRCSVLISNRGGGAASFFSNEMRLSYDSNIDSFDTRLGSCDIFSLSAGASQTVICDGTVPPGHMGFRYVGVVADSPSRVSESDERNNTGAASVNLTVR